MIPPGRESAFPFQDASTTTSRPLLDAPTKRGTETPPGIAQRSGEPTRGAHERLRIECITAVA
jgi:hypothetical protein